MKIKKLTMENFGCFKGKHMIEFSTDEQKPLTVIIGKNGGGKTTLVNAINWCFYKDKPRGKYPADVRSPTINMAHLLEQGKGKTARTSVKVVLQVGDEQYSISRVLTVLIHDIEYDTLEDGHQVIKMAHFADDIVPSGCEVLPNERRFEIMKRGPNDTDFTISTNPDVIMNEILPRDLPVFFLDEEFLESLGRQTDRLKQFSNQSVEQRANLADKMNEIKNMCGSNYLHAEFSFDVDGNIHLVDEQGFNKIRNLAAGENLLVTLIWVLAVKHFVAPNSFLVLDDFLGRISMSHRAHLIPPLFSRGNFSQIIWLVSKEMYLYGHTGLSDEPIPSLRESILKKQVLGKEYEIVDGYVVPFGGK